MVIYILIIDDDYDNRNISKLYELRRLNINNS